MKILVLDNYDSFVYNLVHYIKQLGYEDVDVYRNDKISLEEIAKYDKIVLSPGPGIPEEAGVMIDLIKHYAESKSILGVCLGHQAIAEAFGIELENMDEVLHGVGNTIKVIEHDVIYTGIPNEFEVGRYHSLKLIIGVFNGISILLCLNFNELELGRSLGNSPSKCVTLFVVRGNDVGPVGE